MSVIKRFGFAAFYIWWFTKVKRIIPAAFVFLIIIILPEMAMTKMRLHGKLNITVVEYFNELCTSILGHCSGSCEKNSYSCSPYMVIEAKFGDDKRTVISKVSEQKGTTASNISRFNTYNWKRKGSVENMFPLTLDLRYDDESQGSRLKPHETLGLKVGIYSPYHWDNVIDQIDDHLLSMSPGEFQTYILGMRRWNVKYRQYQSTKIIVQYALKCERNGYGDYCRTWCKGESSRAKGYYFCDRLGKRICQPGWEGDSCKLKLPVSQRHGKFFLSVLSYKNPLLPDIDGYSCDRYNKHEKKLKCKPSFIVTISNKYKKVKGYTTIKDTGFNPVEYPIWYEYRFENLPVQKITNDLHVEIVARDKHGDNRDDVLDNFYINLTTSNADDWKEKTFLGHRKYLYNKKTKSYQQSSIYVKYKLECERNYYGNFCVIWCKGENSTDNGHYKCNKAGRRVCLPGWAGHFCKTKLVERGKFQFGLMFYKNPSFLDIDGYPCDGYNIHMEKLKCHPYFIVTISDKHTEMKIISDYVTIHDTANYDSVFVGSLNDIHGQSMIEGSEFPLWYLPDETIPKDLQVEILVMDKDFGNPDDYLDYFNNKLTHVKEPHHEDDLEKMELQAHRKYNDRTKSYQRSSFELVYKIKCHPGWTGNFCVRRV